MDIQNYINLIAIAGIFIVALFAGFNRKVSAFVGMKYMFPSMLMSSALFVFLEIRFAELGLKEFNPAGFVGSAVKGVPLEKWLMYFVLSFSLFVIYKYVARFSKRSIAPNIYVVVSLALFAIIAIVAYAFRQKVYTLLMFVFCAVYFGYTVFRNRFKKHYQVFYPTFLIGLIPFFILSGITGAIGADVYDAKHLMGLEVFVTPIENVVGFFLLLLMNITIFEYLSERRFY